MSFSLHSSTVCFGSSNLCWLNSRARLPVKSSIGETSRKASLRPSLRNVPKDSRWTPIRSGSSRMSLIFWKVTRSWLPSRGCAEASANPLPPFGDRNLPYEQAAPGVDVHGRERKRAGMANRQYRRRPYRRQLPALQDSDTCRLDTPVG